MKRFQVYLDEAQHVELTRRAEREGGTVSGIVRRALQAELARPDEGDRLAAWHSAVAAAAGAAPYLPEGREYLDEVRAAERGKAAAR